MGSVCTSNSTKTKPPSRAKHSARNSRRKGGHREAGHHSSAANSSHKGEKDKRSRKERKEAVTTPKMSEEESESEEEVEEFNSQLEAEPTIKEDLEMAESKAISLIVEWKNVAAKEQPGKNKNTKLNKGSKLVHQLANSPTPIPNKGMKGRGNWSPPRSPHKKAEDYKEKMDNLPTIHISNLPTPKTPDYEGRSPRSIRSGRSPRSPPGILAESPTRGDLLSALLRNLKKSVQYSFPTAKSPPRESSIQPGSLSSESTADGGEGEKVIFVPIYMNGETGKAIPAQKVEAFYFDRGGRKVRTDQEQLNKWLWNTHNTRGKYKGNNATQLKQILYGGKLEMLLNMELLPTPTQSEGESSMADEDQIDLHMDKPPNMLLNGGMGVPHHPLHFSEFSEQ